MSEAQVAEVDTWISSYKAFDSYQPPWQPIRSRGRDWQATWPIVDLGGISSGKAVFETDAAFTEISISVIYRSNPIFRLDLVPADREEGNEFVALQYASDVPRKFTGTHTHSWDDHRLWVKSNGLGELPIRRPLIDPPTEIDGAFEFISRIMNVSLQPGQRPVILPPQKGLSLGKGR